MTKILSIAAILLLMGVASAGSTSYVHGANGLVAKINETNITYYHSDHLGSSSVLTNEEGAVTSESVYLPFGQPLTGDEKYGFTAKEFEPDLNLNYFGARYYDPNSGRFLRVDPVKDGINWFAYANNNPLKYVDPDGTSNLPAPTQKPGPLDVPTDPFSLGLSLFKYAILQDTGYNSFWGVFLSMFRGPEKTRLPIYRKGGGFNFWNNEGGYVDMNPSEMHKIQFKTVKKMMKHFKRGFGGHVTGLFAFVGNYERGINPEKSAKYIKECLDLIKDAYKDIPIDKLKGEPGFEPLVEIGENLLPALETEVNTLLKTEIPSESTTSNIYNIGTEIMTHGRQYRQNLYDAIKQLPPDYDERLNKLWKKECELPENIIPDFDYIEQIRKYY